MFQKRRKTILFVEGMSCKHCSNKMEALLKEVACVKKVKINLSTGRVLVLSDESLNIDYIKKAIISAGYQLIKVEEFV